MEVYGEVEELGRDEEESGSLHNIVAHLLHSGRNVRKMKWRIGDIHFETWNFSDLFRMRRSVIGFRSRDTVRRSMLYWPRYSPRAILGDLPRSGMGYFVSQSFTGLKGLLCVSCLPKSDLHLAFSLPSFPDEKSLVGELEPSPSFPKLKTFSTRWLKMYAKKRSRSIGRLENIKNR